MCKWKNEKKNAQTNKQKRKSSYSEDILLLKHFGIVIQMMCALPSCIKLLATDILFFSLQLISIRFFLHLSLNLLLFCRNNNVLRNLQLLFLLFNKKEEVKFKKNYIALVFI